MGLRIRAYRPEDKAGILGLWEASGLVVPSNDPVKDIRRKLAVQPELFRVALMEDDVVGTLMAGYDGHRGWLNYLAVHPEFRKTGIGRKRVEEGVRLLAERGCPKINLQVRATNEEAMAFYRKIGFLEDEVKSFGLRLVDDTL